MSAETKKVSFVVTKQRDRVVATANRVETVVSHGTQGPRGIPGAPAGGISEDAGNSIVNGTDGGLYSPDALPTDPLAYYILARN